jgi:3-hydroxybutyrate dehydrogenase
MIFGESEWQTSEMIESQINVNLMGTIKMTRAMLPIARKYKSRIINVSSHCALKSLPTLAIYGATKAGISSFTAGLRLEMKNYGVEAVEFIPGSFSMSSNIAALQSKHAAEMRESFNEEQLNFYGDYFDRLNSHLSVLSGEKEPQENFNENIMSTFEEALMDAPPKSRYICEPMRYKIYHTLFRFTPIALCDWLVWRFVAFPRFQGSKNNS